MKIAFCTPALYQPGGVERVLTLHANWLADRLGWDITIVLTDGAGKEPFYPLSPKVKVVNLGLGFERLWNCSLPKRIALYIRLQRRYRRELSRTLMELRPDITVSLLRREINFINSISDGSRKVGWLHTNRRNYRTFDKEDNNPIKKALQRVWQSQLLRNLQRLDRFVTITNEDRQAWPELANAATIHNPLSFHATRRSDFSKKRVIYVARYHPGKGFDRLFRVWRQVQDLRPDWELVVFGGDDRTPYQQLADSLGLKRCTLNGPVSDIAEEYADSSIFAFTSRYEGFGLVIVEAMECGLPVVAMACPCGPKDIIADGKDGILVADGDTEAMAAALLRLTADEALLRRMAAAAVEKARQFDLDTIMNQWKELYENEL